MSAPSPSRRRGLRRLTAVPASLTCLALAVTVSPARAQETHVGPVPGVAASAVSTAAVSTPVVAPIDEPAEPTKQEAEVALAEVQQILDDEPLAAPDAGSTEPVSPDLSLALRDLALGLEALDRSDRRTARRLLARPTSRYSADVVSYPRGSRVRSDCGPQVCVHWVEGSPDAPPTRDTDDDGVPDQVELTRATLEDVWERTVAMGYRPPIADRVKVGDPDENPRFDVYLADLGGVQRGLYGYCAPEATASADQRYVGSGYCVIDDDFTPREYGGAAPTKSLRETVAHEFFHAVQYGYDALDDLWFMESSATWMEDELFDGANGNRLYLTQSQLAFPQRGLDDPANRYSSWLFLRWLSEKFGPGIVLDAWRAADTVEGPDRWGMEAVGVALAQRGTSLRRELPAYATSLRFADTDFEEASESRFYTPVAPDRTAWVKRRAPRRTLSGLRVPQLASVAVRVPTRRLTSGMRRLVVDVNAPARFRGVTATLVQVRANGRRVVRQVDLDRRGDGRARIGFVRSKVAEVLVVLTGTSTRMNCWEGGELSCEGTRRDDDLPVRLTVTGR